MIRVLICDDSAVVRGAMARLLDGDAGIKLVGSVGDGRAALDALPSVKPDVILLDLEMPVMDGMTALPLLLRTKPKPVVIVASALTQRGASATMAALNAGAADYIPKPTASQGGIADPGFRAELIAKIKGWARVGQRSAAPAPVRRTAPVLTRAPRVLAIAASTGGPQALAAFARRLPRNLPVPVAIVQHMPPGFTAMLAQHLGGLGGPPCAEGRDGEAFERGRVYMAPGDHHMVIRKSPSGAPVIALNRDPAENFCRPAADPMLRSLPPIFGPDVLAVVLTGMGQDGLLGCRAVAQAGGTVFAQDEASSVVWGMPGAVAKAGLAKLQAAPEALADEALSAFRVPA
ncbi:MAG: chemotaxis-specific protein-glutamate methyltransferase CheB [Alphaproteobacteria bacterium]|nr:chemotaxis-specific protein-glutamate methyltransferase CheB [Alphaproteobacteria bacterium]